MFDADLAEGAGKLAERARSILDVDHERLALVHDAHVRLLQRPSRGAGLIVVDQQMNDAPALRR